MFGALAFTLLILSGYYPPEMRAINLDTDWFYRKGGRLFSYVMDRVLNGLNAIADRVVARAIPAWFGKLSRTPITSLLTLYVKATGKGTAVTEDLKPEARPEATTLIPMGMPVLISLVFLFSLFVLFVFLT
jgi:multicomponent Na+:H+ antiporter subunit D